MKQYTFFIFLILTMLVSVSPSWGKDSSIIKLPPKDAASAFAYPSIDPKGIIGEIFNFYEAEWISGLTCKIKYNGKKPLPSKVFFSAYDRRGKEISHRIRLIYPNLKNGESGYVTFRISNSANLIVIWAEGNGPWESPY